MTLGTANLPYTFTVVAFVSEGLKAEEMKDYDRVIRDIIDVEKPAYTGLKELILKPDN